jgi:hypothetical protein
MNKHQKYLFIILVVCCSLSIIRRFFIESYKEGESEEIGDTEDEMSLEETEEPSDTEDEMSLEEPSDTISYDKIDCVGHFEDQPCPGYCGYEGGKIDNKWITEVNPQYGGEACPSDEVKECPATDPCPIDCEGYHNNFPSCSTYCGYEGGTVTRKWVTTKEPNQTGEACPTDMEVTCPSIDPCISVQSVMTY